MGIRADGTVAVRRAEHQLRAAGLLLRVGVILLCSDKFSAVYRHLIGHGILVRIAENF